MTKKLPIALLASAAVISSWAVPARPGWRTLTQPDGSEIRVNIIGDEFYHRIVNADGQQCVRNADGWILPVDEAEAAKIKAEGTRRRGRRNLPLRAASENQSQVPHVGSPRVPVLLVQYSDYKFKDADPLATFNSFFESGSTSARQYFTDQSNGAFTPEFDVYGPITLTGKRSDYGGNDYEGYDKGVGRMVAEGCLGLDSSIDFSVYDNDGDGECDVVIVLYAGDGEASSYDDDCEDAVWPCQWSLDSSDYGKSLTLDNTKVDLFAVFNELNGSDLSRIDGVGTFCHEFSHCLGLPDFYDTQYGPHFGMGVWSLMDTGCYNNDCYTPIGYSAYEKEFMSWINIPEGEENTNYLLTPMNLGSAATDMAVRLTNDADSDEYYILENRKRQGWDAYMPAEGLLITHFTYDASAWELNEVNDYDLQRATIIPADNNLLLDVETYYGEKYYYINEANLLTDLWPQSYATELTDSSTPAAKVNTGGYMSKPVTEITRNDDSTISFWVMKAPLPAVETPQNPSHTVLSSTSALIKWEGSDPNTASYTIELMPYVENAYIALGSTLFNSTSHGWIGEGYTGVEEAEEGIRLGSGNQLGKLTSAEYAVAEGHDCVTVEFDAKYYSNDGSQVNVCLVDSKGNNIASRQVTLTGSYTTYNVVFDLPESTLFKVRFETLAKKKRLYIRSVDIYSGDASVKEYLPADRRAAAAKKLTFSGITGNSYTVSGLESGGIYDYRIQAVPADKESYSASEWTSPERLDLSLVSGVALKAVDASAEAEWYTLQGVRLSGRPTESGIYVRVAGGKAEKLTIVK